MEVKICEDKVIHKDVVDKVRKNMPDEEILFDLSEVFKVFSDSTRIKILSMLMQSRMCVCDIAYAINTSQSAVSHQLRVLKQARLVKYQKEGKIVYYSLDDDHIEQIFNSGLEHVLER